MLTATPADTRTGDRARWSQRGERLVSAESVAVARILFGVLAAGSAARFLGKGWVETLYLAPEHHLTFPGAGWVHPWPPALMYAHVIALVLLGLAIAVGYRTRLSALLYTVGFLYVELIDATLYLNHYWFMTLMGILMVALPVASHWSRDASSGRVAASPVVPLAVVWALRAQLAVVYIFAGIAKLNGDWLFRAQPLQIWFADHSSAPLVGPLLGEPAVAYLASWAGAAFDLTIVGWLLWPRTRRFAFAAVIVFHLVTGALFPIGVFPWVMGLSALIFFDPDWPSQLRSRCFGASAGPSRTSGSGVARTARITPMTRRFLIVFAVVQIALPLRHYALSSNVRWSEEGYYLSWRVMLTEKTGSLEFLVTDPGTGAVWEVGPEAVLTDWQTTQAAIRPDLIRQSALLIEASYGRDLEVRAISWVSMNGRPATRLIDPDVDLTQTNGSDWILPAP